MSTRRRTQRIPLLIIGDEDRPFLEVYLPEDSPIRVVNPMRVAITDMRLAVDYKPVGDGSTPAPAGCPTCARALSLKPDLSERAN